MKHVNYTETPKIRVRDFAKTSHTDDNAEQIIETKPIINISHNLNGETISISSDDEKPIIKKKRKKRSTAQTEPKTPRVNHTIVSRSRTRKTPLDTAQYHKISDFFQSAKKECKYISIAFYLIRAMLMKIRLFGI